VADDSRNDFILLQAAFAAAGLNHDLRLVRDGDEVIAYLKGESPFSDRTNCPLPDLLILDVQMPKSGAFDVLRFLAGSPKHCVPAVVLSGSIDPRLIQKALELGALECFDKPMCQDELVSIVRTIHHRWLANPIQQPTGDQPVLEEARPIYTVLFPWP